MSNLVWGDTFIMFNPHSRNLFIVLLKSLLYSCLENPMDGGGREESDTTERLHFHFSPSCIGEGNGNPLQCFCLKNPRDGGAWWAAVYGVAPSQTWLKRLSGSSSKSLYFPGNICGLTIWVSYILCVHTKLLPLCLNLWDSKDCSLPGSSLYGILQARALE